MLELAGSASYETVSTERRPRQNPLVRFPDPFPFQGRMALWIGQACPLRRAVGPRQRVAAARATSCSAVAEQAPM